MKTKKNPKKHGNNNTYERKHNITYILNGVEKCRNDDVITGWN